MKKPKIEPPRPAALSRRNFFGSVASGAAEAAILTLPVEAAQPAAAPARRRRAWCPPSSTSTARLTP